MKFLLLLTALFGCSNAIAVTYYVDAVNGNDVLSGKTASLSATNGPWQSIAKVNAALLQPGDQVLFSCGQTWYETLSPGKSGTAASKIYIGSYPAQCNNKPKISGFRSILGNNWQPYKGNIWKTTFPQNLIINSKLSASVANWAKWPSDASLTFNTSCPLSVAGCMKFIAGTSTNSSLAVSNTFPVVGNKKYTVSASIYAPINTSVLLIVRESGNSYRPLGIVKKITGNGQWQDLSFNFTSTQTLANARLDIDVPKNKQIFVRSANIQESGLMPVPSMVLFDGDPVTIAHHPNAGHDTTLPESVYLRTTAASPTVIDTKGLQVSSQIVVGDLKLPSGGSIGPGTKLKLRPLDWEINDYAVTAAGTNTISIAPNTRLPLSQAGWGFYFYDALWMLDSPGEWFFDSATQTIYLWTSANKNPGNKVSVATIKTAIDLKSKSNILVENMEIDGASTGIDISLSTNITLQSLNVHNINSNAINATQSVDATIVANRINRVADSGVSGIDANKSTNALIENNVLEEIGAFVKAGKRISLPMTTKFGIHAGKEAIIANNSLSDIGGNAIEGGINNDIDSNIIQRSCLNITDCGAIYSGNTSMIQKNLITEAPGSLEGTPDGTYNHTNGIYLDEGGYGISVIGNTVKGATHSVQLHRASQSTISNNIFYGTDSHIIYQNESSLINGGVFGNIITNNQLFPTKQYSVAVHSISTQGAVDNFASYDGNHYSTIHSPIIVSESGLEASKQYTLLEWQNAKTKAGIARNNDLNGGNPAPLPSFALGLVSNNFMPNADFSAGLEGWITWNAAAPYASKNLEGCLPVSVNCIHVSAGASMTLVHSPLFPITKGKLYRVTFDLKSTVTTGYLYPQVLFAGGPNKYQSLMKDPIRLPASTEWERHSFIFEATGTASSPTIKELGARFDINGLPANQNLWLANLEIANYNPGTLGPTITDLLVNTTDAIKTMDCPTRLNNPSLCSNFVIFPEASVAVWPILVPPRSGRIVFTQNFSLLDTDSDGIADSQDDCTQTINGQVVNGRGCSLAD